MKISDFPVTDNYQVAILMGSDSDLPVMEKTYKILSEFGVATDIKVISAHRNPKQLEEYISEAPDRGVKVFICGAGMAAHLGGVVASKTTLPVIGVPCLGKSTGGLDSLLSMVQMPKGVPVATVAIDGAMNAGILAIQILALNNKVLAKKIGKYREDMAEKERAKNV